jgi:hypothetical protein
MSCALTLRWSECGTLADLSPAAVEQLQAACTQAVTQSYADGVDALVFVAPKRDPDATPEEAAAAQAAAEAAVKIQKNKVAIVDDILQVCGDCRKLARTRASLVQKRAIDCADSAMIAAQRSEWQGAECKPLAPSLGHEMVMKLSDATVLSMLDCGKWRHRQ